MNCVVCHTPGAQMLTYYGVTLPVCARCLYSDYEVVGFATAYIFQWAARCQTSEFLNRVFNDLMDQQEANQ